MTDNKINTIEFDDWQKYIDYKKLILLETIDKSNCLDNSNDNKAFITILKKIIAFKLFNISHIAFLLFKLLENSSIINSSVVHDTINDINNTSVLDTSKNKLNIILKSIIDFVINVEITLNFHCILIIQFLIKSRTPIPKSLSIYETINNDTAKVIKPSTHILLLLKFIRKLGNIQLDNTKINTIKNISKYKSVSRTTYKNDSIKYKLYLDTFMLNINNNDNNKNNVKCDNNKYDICSDYIISLVDLLYSKLDNFFNILEECIEDSLEIDNSNKIIKLKSIRESIKEICNKEINKCKEIFRNETY